MAAPSSPRERTRPSPPSSSAPSGHSPRPHAAAAGRKVAELLERRRWRWCRRTGARRPTSDRSRRARGGSDARRQPRDVDGLADVVHARVVLTELDAKAIEEHPRRLRAPRGSARTSDRGSCARRRAACARVAASGLASGGASSHARHSAQAQSLHDALGTLRVAEADQRRHELVAHPRVGRRPVGGVVEQAHRFVERLLVADAPILTIAADASFSSSGARTASLRSRRASGLAGSSSSA